MNNSNNQCHSIEEHPNEIELLEVINETFHDFKEYWNTEGDYFIKNDGSFSVHSVFAVLSHYMKGHKQFLNENNLSKLFKNIENWIKINPNSPSGISNAICTCFLENLAGEGELSKLIYGYLGKKSKEYFDLWNNN